MATKMLSEKLGEVEYDNLIVGLTPPKRVGAGKIASTGSEEATYTRGTVFAKSAKDGKLYILGSTAASGDTLTADCILTDEVTVPATGDATTTVYLAGCFNPDKLVVSLSPHQAICANMYRTRPLSVLRVLEGLAAGEPPPAGAGMLVATTAMPCGGHFARALLSRFPAFLVLFDAAGSQFFIADLQLDGAGRDVDQDVIAFLYQADGTASGGFR